MRIKNIFKILNKKTIKKIKNEYENPLNLSNKIKNDLTLYSKKNIF